MVSLADVRRWEPAALEEIFRTLGKRRDELVGLEDELDGVKNPPDWEGEAAGPAAKRHAGLTRSMRELIAEVSSVRTAVGNASDDVEAIRRRLAETESTAEAHGFQITAEGGVRDAHPPEDVPEDEVEQVRQQRLQVRDRLVEDVRKILIDAKRTDAELAEVLDSADKDRIEPGKGDSLASAANTTEVQALAASVRPPEGGSPEDNARWWKSLPEDQREALRQNPPAWLGNRDGIPAEIRDRANRARMGDERAALTAKKAELEQGGVSDDEKEELAGVEAKIKSVDAVQKMLDRGDRQLMLLDTGGERAKAAVAVGNVDTADHVAVFTPGFNTTVDGSLNADKQMDELRRQAQYESDRYGEGGEVAAVTWVGTEFPQWSEIADPDRSVASSEPAEKGGQKLGDFYKGINASREDDPHLTALGHSYGSTMTGYGLQQDGHGVDDAVLFGSPGAGTGDVQDLGLPEGHAYRIEARDDKVADLARFGGDPSHLDGMTGLSAKDSEVGGRKLAEVTGHSSYFTPDSTSQYNMSTVVAGLPDRAVRDDGRGFGDVISWPVSKISGLF
ncbi:alpha/beta hydrolase [Saccharopolyspora taberi]|uniref:Alpha/beta hydrolase n=1 Tax=Saccharopolyspora taberi TaxID=60895 RepID=A0ABN3VJL9_9PSEU